MMLDTNTQKYLDEAIELYKKHSHGSHKGNKFFGIISGGILQAVGSVKCYYGTWYLRGCYVKPEFRGLGLQRKLIRERIKYLKDKTDKVKVSISKENSYSIDNVVAEGFRFKGKQTFSNGVAAILYIKEI